MGKAVRRLTRQDEFILIFQKMLVAKRERCNIRLSAAFFEMQDHPLFTWLIDRCSREIDWITNNPSAPKNYKRRVKLAHQALRDLPTLLNVKQTEAVRIIWRKFAENLHTSDRRAGNMESMIHYENRSMRGTL